MRVIITLFVIDILIPGLIIWVVYRFKPRFLWCTPVLILLTSAFLFIYDVSSYSSEPAFAKKWELYFHNDASMGFYLIYLPIIAASIIITLIAYLFKHLKEKRM